ncbi:hypothetical protein BC829DRAFT_445411 [Chytridium lagenaria]|nr:hypothetical protein BC829DRAFT_445411 [Chytridium lagenaria]
MRESKKIVSLILRSAKDASDKAGSSVDSSTVDVSSVQSAVYNFLRVTGIILHLPYIHHWFFGGCTRHSGLLGCYMSTLIFDIILTLAVGIYSIVVLVNKMKEWDQYDTQKWKDFTPVEKITTSNSDAFVGKSLFVDNNTCISTSLSSYPGCQSAGHDFYYRLALFDGIGSAVILLILLISAGAAHHARRQYHLEPASQPMVTVQNRY